MKDKDDIKILLDNFQKLENRPIQYDEDAIVSAYQKDNEGQSLPIKILSIFGGILASLAFLGFLMITGLYNSGVGLLVTGGLLIAGSILSIKVNDSIIIDTLRVSSYIIGFTLIGFGCEQLKLDENIISIIFIIIALSSLIITQNYILSFVSVIIINGSILALVLRNNAFNFIPIYISILALVMTYFFLKEANIITKSKVLSELYNPVKTGLIFSFLIALVFLGKKGIVTISLGYILYSSGILILAIVYLISILFNVLDVTQTREKINIYIFTILTLLPTALSPAISGAILVILLSFYVNYKTGFVLGIISFSYFIFQYYYDLNFTLLTKSILLFSSGLIFIALYLFSSKKLIVNEKV